MGHYSGIQGRSDLNDTMKAREGECFYGTASGLKRRIHDAEGACLVSI